MGEFFFLNSMVRHGAKLAVFIVIAIVAIGVAVTVHFGFPQYVIAPVVIVAAILGYFVMVIVDLVKIIKDMLMPQ